jgi:hypothetical protein
MKYGLLRAPGSRHSGKESIFRLNVLRHGTGLKRDQSIWYVACLVKLVWVMHLSQCSYRLGLQLTVPAELLILMETQFAAEDIC